MKEETVEASAIEGGPDRKPSDSNPENSHPLATSTAGDGQGEQEIHQNFYKLPAALQTDFDAIEQKPWNQEGVDPSDYFNYGFDEEMFKIYQQKVRDNFNTLNRELLQEEILQNKLDLDHKLVNFHLPHEAGGCGMAKSQEYMRVNTYRVVEDDAPVLCNKSHGFYVKIVKNGLQNIPDIPGDEGEGDMLSAMPPGMWGGQMMMPMGQGMPMMMPPDIEGYSDGKRSRRRPQKNDDRRRRRRDDKYRDKRHEDSHFRPDSNRDSHRDSHRDSRRDEHREGRNRRSRSNRESPSRRDDRNSDRRSRNERSDSRRENDRHSDRHSDRPREDSRRDRPRDGSRRSDDRREDPRRDQPRDDRRSEREDRGDRSNREDRDNHRGDRDHDRSDRGNGRDRNDNRNPKRRRSPERNSQSDRESYKRSKR